MQHQLALDAAKSEPASPTASSSAGKQGKKSQRPSWSCTECTRRKIRCDRVVPGCNQCIKRNKVHLCRLDQDDKIGFGPDSSAGEPSLHPVEPSPPGQPRFASAAEFEAIQRNVTVVRQRLFHLERVVAAFVPRPDVLDASGQPSWAVDMTALHHGGGGGPSSGAADGYAPSSSAQHDAYTPHAAMHDAYPASTHHHPPADAYPSSAPTPSGISLGPPPSHRYAPAPAPGPSPSYALPPHPQPQPQPQPAYDEPRPAHPLYSRHSSGGVTEDDGEVEAAVTLEYLALGRDGQSAHVSRAELRRPAADEGEQRVEAPGGDANGHGHGHGHSASVAGGQAPSGPPPASALDELEQPPAALGPAAGSAASAPPPSPASVLPPPSTAAAILQYSLERVGWQHGAVHAGQFLAECAEFDSWGPLRADKVNQAWLALYLAVLCVGVKHMNADDARACGLTPDDVRVLPKLWFDASVDALHRGQFLAKHSVFAVQTIVILVISCQDVGGSDLIATLLACGIRIAQHLGISRLGADDEWDRKRRAAGVDPASEEGVKGLVQREVRKRLWWALATEDWLSVPFRRSYSISPSHFTTPAPLNCHDEDLSSGTAVDRPQDEATCVSKVLVAHKVAACIRHFFEDVNSRPDRELSYDLLLDVDREIRDIIETGPAFLRADDDKAIEAQPPWVRWMLHWWIMSVSHKLLMCHRVFLGRSFRDSRFAFSRKAAIEAARSIIQELVKGSQLPFQHLWTVPYHSISAAVVVILDIFQSSSSDPDLVHKRREVQSVLDELRVLSDEGNSQIASRGIQLLTTLLAEEQRHRRPHKRKAAELGNGNGNGGGGGHERSSASASPAKRVVSISDSRTSLGAPSSHGAFAPQHHPHPPPPSHAQAPPPPHSNASPFPYFVPTQPYAHLHGVASASTLDATSPHDSHVSDTSLTQDAFESLLSNLGGWSGAGGGGGGAGEAGGAFGPGVDGPYGVPQQHGAYSRAGGGAGAGARGGLGPAAYGGPGGEAGDQTGDFFIMLDAGSFLGDGGEGASFHGHHAPTPGGQAGGTLGQSHGTW